MSDRWVMATDPREGEEPDDEARAVAVLADLDDLRGITQSAHRCEHGIDLERAGCGRCLDAVEPWGARRELTQAEVTEAFAAFFRQKLDQIQRDEDEQMGAHFAARFSKGD